MLKKIKDNMNTIRRGNGRHRKDKSGSIIGEKVDVRTEVAVLWKELDI